MPGGIGIIYESDEWSTYALRDDIEALGVRAELIDMEQPITEEKLLTFGMIVNRVFASAVFRGHSASLARMPGVIDLLTARGIPMLNPGPAHFYEISKKLSTLTLGRNGFTVPQVYGIISPGPVREMNPLEGVAALDYPCVVKPDCGGRTTFTHIARSPEELSGIARSLPDMEFIVQEYIPPERGYLTRIEVIGGECALILQRSVAENGLSAYHLGSTYSHYDDCPADVREAATGAAGLLGIEVGSLDIIENSRGFYIIDVNSVSNVSEDNTEMFDFDLMKETASYTVKKYNIIYSA